MAIICSPRDERLSPEESQAAIISHLPSEFAKVRDGFAVVFPPPAIDGLGNASGFQLQLQDRGNLGLDQLGAVAQDIVVHRQRADGTTSLEYDIPPVPVPQLFVDIDRTKVKSSACRSAPSSTHYRRISVRLM